MSHSSHKEIIDRILLWVKENGSLIFIPVAFFLFLNYVLDFNGLYGQDSHEYLRFAKALKTGTQSNHSIEEFRWPKGYPRLGTLLSSIGLPVLTSLRLISLFAFIGLLLVVKRTIQLIFHNDAQWYLILGAATQIYFMRAGMLVMSDMLTAFYIVCVFYFLIQQEIKNKSVYFLGVLLFSVLAFLTRYASAPILIGALSYAIYLSGKRHGWWLLALATILIGVGAFFLMRMNNNWSTLSIAMMDQWSWSNVFSRSFHSSDGVSVHLVPNIMYVFGNFFHLGFLSFGVILLPFYKKLLPLNKKVVGSVLLYLVLLIGLSTQNYRFLVISHSLVLILLYPTYESLSRWLKGKHLYLFFILGTLLVNLVFGIYSFRKTLLVHNNEKAIVNELKKHIKNEPIYSFYVDQSLPSYEITNEVRNFYKKDYLEFEKGALVVFNENKFNKQWKDHRVMNNWNRLKANYELDTLATLSGNWEIYRIK